MGGDDRLQRPFASAFLSRPLRIGLDSRRWNRRSGSGRSSRLGLLLDLLLWLVGRNTRSGGTGVGTGRRGRFDLGDPLFIPSSASAFCSGGGGSSSRSSRLFLLWFLGSASGFRLVFGRRWGWCGPFLFRLFLFARCLPALASARLLLHLLLLLLLHLLLLGHKGRLGRGLLFGLFALLFMLDFQAPLFGTEDGPAGLEWRRARGARRAVTGPEEATHALDIGR